MNEKNTSQTISSETKLSLELDALDLPSIQELEVADSLGMHEAGASIGYSGCCSSCCA